MDEILLKKIEKIYDECKETFTPDIDVKCNCVKFDDIEKKHFFMYVSDFFLRMQQRKVISEEKY